MNSPGDGAADDFVVGGEAGAAGLRGHLEDNMSVLTATAALFHEFAFTVRTRGNGLTVSDLRFSGGGFHGILGAHPLLKDLEVQFSHSGDDGLAGFLVAADDEGGIFLGEAGQGEGHLLLIGGGPGFHGHGDDGLGKSRGFEHDAEPGFGDGIAGGDVLDADNGGDVPGVAGFDIAVLVALDLDQASDAFLLAGPGVDDHVSFGDGAGVDADEDELADKLIAPEFEGESAEWGGIVGGGEDILVVILGGMTADCGDFQRAGEVIDDGIDEVLDPFVFEGGSADHGNQGIGDGGATNGFLHLGRSDGGAVLKELLHEDVVHFGEGLDQGGEGVLGNEALVVVEVFDGIG